MKARIRVHTLTDQSQVFDVLVSDFVVLHCDSRQSAEAIQHTIYEHVVGVTYEESMFRKGEKSNADQ